jgi:hypothetical protein
MPTASHRGIHQKIKPSGINITAINAITHSIFSSSVASQSGLLIGQHRDLVARRCL